MRRRILPAVFLCLALFSAPQAMGGDYLWQTNAEGDDIHVFDIETGALVRRLVVGANPHGVAYAPSSDTVFVSLEKNGQEAGELLWIDRKSFSILHRLEIGPEPHAIAATPDGRWVYVPCRDGNYWVIDAEKHKVAAKIQTGGRPHNTTAAPDGARVYLSPMGAPKKVTLVDPKAGHKVVGAISFSASVRPPAIAASRNLFFQHIDGLNGFEVADLTQMKVIDRIRHSGSLGAPMWPKAAGFLSLSGLRRCHGLAVRPDETEIWSVCGERLRVHAIDDDVFPETAAVTLPGKAYWLTFSPDGRFAFVALSAQSRVAMVNVAKREIVKFLDAGEYPKRNIVIEN